MGQRTLDSSGMDEPNHIAERKREADRQQLISDIRTLIELRNRVQRQAVTLFPIGSRVRRKSTYVIGRVHCTVAGFPERLGIVLENGNVWDYPVEELERLD